MIAWQGDLSLKSDEVQEIINLLSDEKTPFPQRYYVFMKKLELAGDLRRREAEDAQKGELEAANTKTDV